MRGKPKKSYYLFIYTKFAIKLHKHSKGGGVHTRLARVKNPMKFFSQSRRKFLFVAAL